MTIRRIGVALLLTLLLAMTAAGQDSKPLVLKSEGSFFVGGETKKANVAGAGGDPGPADITVNQMHVQYQIPIETRQHVPVVMVHGCCLSSMSWETTPDGRMGWNEYFVRKNRAVYLADQVARARSGFDASIINTVKSGAAPPSQLPTAMMLSHEASWGLFRFGPTFNKAFPDEQFPVEAADEFYKQMIPDFNSILPTPNPTWKNMAALAVQLHGAVLIGHSESGFFPEEAAMIDATGIRGIVTLETGCTTTLKPDQLSILARVPTLVMFGDHLSDVPGHYTELWMRHYNDCQKFVAQLKAAGGDVEMMDLPKMGIHGNSHMMMQDKNNLQLADLILKWIDQHVENHRISPGRGVGDSTSVGKNPVIPR